MPAPLRDQDQSKVGALELVSVVSSFKTRPLVHTDTSRPVRAEAGASLLPRDPLRSPSDPRPRHGDRPHPRAHCPLGGTAVAGWGVARAEPSPIRALLTSGRPSAGRPWSQRQSPALRYPCLVTAVKALRHQPRKQPGGNWLQIQALPRSRSVSPGFGWHHTRRCCQGASDQIPPPAHLTASARGSSLGFTSQGLRAQSGPVPGPQGAPSLDGHQGQPAPHRGPGQAPPSRDRN